MTLAGISADVAIAPLDANDFNLSKSNLKLLEYGACGYPVIASAVGPYLAAARESAPNACVSLCHTPEAWLGNLRAHYNNTEYRAEMAKNSLDYARKHGIVSKVEYIERFFATL